MNSQLTGKDPDDGKDCGQEEKGTTEDEMVGWHHRLDGHEFEQIPGDGEGQGNLACCSPWGRKESDMTERLNDKNFILLTMLGLCCSEQAFSSGRERWLLLCGAVGLAGSAVVARGLVVPRHVGPSQTREGTGGTTLHCQACS